MVRPFIQTLLTMQTETDHNHHNFLNSEPLNFCESVLEQAAINLPYNLFDNTPRKYKKKTFTHSHNSSSKFILKTLPTKITIKCL